MGLVERLAAGVPVRQSRVERQIEMLLPEEQAALLTAALDPAWSDEALVRVLQDEGLVVGHDALTAWRAKAREVGQIPVPVPDPVREPPADPAPLVDPLQ